MTNVILFDADGVMTHQQQRFTTYYTNRYKLDLATFTKFFETDWKDFVTGKKDLKEHIKNNPDFWQWSGEPSELLKLWFETEDARNYTMIKLVKKIRASGTACYLATEQEQYRADYMKNVMFQNVFDGYFVTADIGYKKSDHRFFETAVAQLRQTNPELDMNDVIFFDDSQSKVDAAIAVGIDGILFDGIESATSKLKATNVPF